MNDVWLKELAEEQTKRLLEYYLNNPARRVGRGFRCSRQDFSHWDALEPRFSPELRFS